VKRCLRAEKQKHNDKIGKIKQLIKSCILERMNFKVEYFAVFGLKIKAISFF